MPTVKNILVTGANGQLGMEFRLLANQYPEQIFLFASREDLPIEDKAAVRAFFDKHAIDCCINCAAYTAVDKAESERDVAIAINTTAAGNLAAICKAKNAIFFHFSTDYVFDGQATKPYLEDDITDPVNFYGQTKLDGELAVLFNNPDALVIRTSWVYSRYGKNFVKTMLRLMQEKESIGVIADQFGCPTYAADLAAAVMQILNGGRYLPGIYHYPNEGVISWNEFANTIKMLIGSPCKVNAIETAAFPTPAARPHYSALNTRKIQAIYEIQIPDWKESLATCVSLLTAEN